MDSADFNEWISRQLEWPWPPVLIPRGIVVGPTTTEVPLTFRAVLRHIYRRAEAWSTFANDEQEYYRRAVVAFLLGVAPQVYNQSLVRLGRAEQRMQDLGQRRIELRALLNDIVKTTTEGFRSAGTTSLDSLQETADDLESQLAAANARRDTLVASLRSDPRYDRDNDRRLGRLHRDMQTLIEKGSDLAQIVEEQRKLLSALQGDLQRLYRAQEASSTLRSITVTMCPACFRHVSSSLVEGDACYVCKRPLGSDQRVRRLELEERAITAEITELASVVDDLEQRLQGMRSEQQALADQRQQLTEQLDRERRELIAPVLRELETVQRAIGQLDQRRDSLQKLKNLNVYVEQIDKQRSSVDQEWTTLQSEVMRTQSDRGLVAQRTTLLASYMNQFIGNLSVDALGGTVSVDNSDFAFYVGRDNWMTVLGSERRVIFLLAYHYALLMLAANHEGLHPGLAILDNPFQQDAPAELIQEALEQLTASAVDNEDLQIVVATRRQLPSIPGSRLYFTNVYDPEPFDSGTML